MSPERIAYLLKARRAGRMKWIARCPAHDDRSPSLSISTGRDGRILLHCFAGCSTGDILQSLGLKWTDLFAGSQHRGFDELAFQERQAIEEFRRQEWHATHSALCNRALRYERLIEELGRRLATLPDDSDIGDQLSALFHVAVERLRATEAALEGLKTK